MLDYTHLEALVAVQREGSFEAAGKHLGMSAIGVAKRIRKLEERMGVPLVVMIAHVFGPKRDEAPNGINNLIPVFTIDQRANRLPGADIITRRIIPAFGTGWNEIESLVIFSPGILNGEPTTH